MIPRLGGAGESFFIRGEVSVDMVRWLSRVLLLAGCRGVWMMIILAKGWGTLILRLEEQCGETPVSGWLEPHGHRAVEGQKAWAEWLRCVFGDVLECPSKSIVGDADRSAVKTNLI
jgi:hypothetical protein